MSYKILLGVSSEISTFYDILQNYLMSQCLLTAPLQRTATLKEIDKYSKKQEYFNFVQ